MLFTDNALVGREVHVDFSKHQNRSCSPAKTILGIGVGAVRLDGLTCYFGAGLDDAYREGLACVRACIGSQTGLDPLAMMGDDRRSRRSCMSGDGCSVRA